MSRLFNLLSLTIISEQKGRCKSFHENQIIGRKQTVVVGLFLQIRPKTLIEGL